CCARCAARRGLASAADGRGAARGSWPRPGAPGVARCGALRMVRADGPHGPAHRSRQHPNVFASPRARTRAGGTPGWRGVARGLPRRCGDRGRAPRRRGTRARRSQGIRLRDAGRGALSEDALGATRYDPGGAVATPFDTIGKVGAVAPGPGSRVRAIVAPVVGVARAVNEAVPVAVTWKPPIGTGPAPGAMAQAS